MAALDERRRQDDASEPGVTEPRAAAALSHVDLFETIDRAQA